MDIVPDWERAEAYLNKVIAAYVDIGWTGSFALYFVLLPLKRRYDGGELTQALYDEIMECE